MAALQSDNPKLRSLVVLYLEYVGTEHAKELISTLMKMEGGDPVPHDLEGEVGITSEVGLVIMQHSNGMQQRTNNYWPLIHACLSLKGHAELYQEFCNNDMCKI